MTPYSLNSRKISCIPEDAGNLACAPWRVMPLTGQCGLCGCMFEFATKYFEIRKHLASEDLMMTQPDQDPTLSWRKSLASGGDGACVEVAQSGSFILVRDSRDQLGAVLRFTQAQWHGLVRRTKVTMLPAVESPP